MNSTELVTRITNIIEFSYPFVIAIILLVLIFPMMVAFVARQLLDRQFGPEILERHNA